MDDKRQKIQLELALTTQTEGEAQKSAAHRRNGWPPSWDGVRAPHTSIVRRGGAAPIWFFGFPLAAMGMPITHDDGESVEIPSPDKMGRSCLLKWAPWLLTDIWFWTGAVSEDTGERVDPRWLFAAAFYWFADFLIVAYPILPSFKSRRVS